MMVQVLDRQNEHLIDTKAIALAAQRMLHHLGVNSAEISIVFVDNPSIAALNRRFLDHEGPTDIITFPMSSGDDPNLEGELVISVPWAAEVASGHGDRLADELVLYVCHGILHLLGQDDVSPEDAAVMKRRELALLTELGLPVPRGRFEHLDRSEESV